MSRYRVEHGWPELPSGWSRGEVPGVAVDAADHVYLLVRADPPVRVYSPEGRPLASWGTGIFKRPHGISVSLDGSVYIVDDWGHAIYRFLPSGELDLMLTRQSKDCSYDQLVDPDRPESVTRVSPPFNYPTHAIEARGSIYVADGYGNARVHVFTRAGEYTRGWGEPGDQSGAFRLPHGLALGVDGELYVADRLNARVQLFDLDGGPIGAWPARHPNAVAVDADGSVYVAELGSVFSLQQRR